MVIPSSDPDGKRAKQARQWRSARMERFAQTQRRERNWINVEEIGELCSELDGSGVPNEAARENAYRNFECALLLGDFEENGRSRVLYLHPWTVRTRMTREWLGDAIRYNYDGHRGRSQFLPWCWIPRCMWDRLAANHNLPISPPRFEPQHSRDRSSNKGGRPPAADWEALKDALREEIKKHGYPDPGNPPGWRQTKDVADWAQAKLGREVKGVSRRTIGDNVRRTLRELKKEAASTAKPVSR